MRVFPVPQLDVLLVDKCPICASDRIEYAFAVAQQHVWRCLECTMLFLREIHGTPRLSLDLSNRVRECVVDFMSRMTPTDDRTLVVIPPGSVATVADCDILTADTFCDQAAVLPHYDRVLCVDVLDRVADPHRLLRHLHTVVKSGGGVGFLLPSVDSAAAHYSGGSWWGFRSGARRFFGVDTLQNLLIMHGFRDPKPYFDGRLNRGSLRIRAVGTFVTKLRLGHVAASVQRRAKLIDDSMFVACTRGEHVLRHRLSVIVPVFNEFNTFSAMMERLVAKVIDDVDIEIIIVESNSSDGSREQVLKFSEHPRIIILLQDEPKGKGNAVRAGLKRATGDIVLFQDADLEYDIDDYDVLIRPIRENRRNFVIGSRHGNAQEAWKIRDFNGAPVLSQVFNVGHLIFLGLLNGIYGQHLDDPFSMFKVFRRDCIAGLDFVCDRFDFDFEIVIKLLRKGYHPLEIPINYHSRSIAEGKKVTMLRDPLTWLRALMRFRTSDLYQPSLRRP
jgi:hypothetical protein